MPQEIDALFKGQKQNCVVYFLDETFEELAYDASSTVAEAVEALAGQIKLENYQTFSLFAVSKVRGGRRRGRRRNGPGGYGCRRSACARQALEPVWHLTALLCSPPPRCRPSLLLSPARLLMTSTC